MFGIFSKRNDYIEAIEDKNIQILNSLLPKIKINETFSNPNNSDEKAWNYLLHACKFGNIEVVEFLLENGSDVNHIDSGEKTPLYWATTNKDDGESAKICILLIKKGININHQSKDGKTALFGAVGGVANYEKGTITLEVLLNAGADADLRDKDDQVGPLDLAVSSITGLNGLAVVKMLLKFKANPNIVNIDGITPLFSVAWNKTEGVKIAKVLIKYGADINHSCIDENGIKTYPLDAAIGQENKPLVKYFLDNDAKYNPEFGYDLEIVIEEK
jgi:ankyrin repeat protein